MKVHFLWLYISIAVVLSPISASAAGESINSKTISCINILLGKSLNAREPGHVTYPDAPTEKFQAIFIGPQGMQHVQGQTTNVGNLAFVTYQKEGRSPEKIVGRVINDYQAGMDIMDERTGQVFSCNVNFGKIISAQVKPSSTSWITTNEASDLAAAMTRTPNPYAIVNVNNNGFKRTIYGKLTRREVESGYFAFAIEDSNGAVHLFDPAYTGFDAAVSSGNAETETYFPPQESSSADPLLLIDVSRSPRLKWAKELQASQSVYNNPDCYHFLEQDVPSVKKLLQRWYPAQAALLIRSVETTLGSKFVILLADPGIANRSAVFLKFGKDYVKQHPDASPWQLRQAFSDHLGSRKIYRGMVLTEAEAGNLTNNGILAPGMLNPENAATSLFETFEPNRRYDRSKYPHSPKDEIVARLTDFYEANTRMFISVSDYEPIAASIGYHDSGKADDPNRHLYVFEINIPEISLIKQEGLFVQEMRTRSDVIIKIGTDQYNETRDPGVEIFVPYKIDASNIASVKLYDTPPLKWERELKK